MKSVFAGQDDHRPRRGRGAKLSPAREADRALALRDRVPHLGGHFIQFLRDAGHRRSGARALYGDALVVAFQVEPVYSQTDETEPAMMPTQKPTVCTLSPEWPPSADHFVPFGAKSADEAHLTNWFKRASQ